MNNCNKGEAEVKGCLYFTISKLFRIVNKVAEEAFNKMVTEKAVCDYLRTQVTIKDVKAIDETIPYQNVEKDERNVPENETETGNKAETETNSQSEETTQTQEETTN